jgi:hypothetical protein
MSFKFGQASCGRALHCVGAPNLRTCGRALRLRCRRALGHPTCGRALRCVGVPNLRTCLALRWGAQLADVPCLGEAVLKSRQNLFLPILQLVLPCVDIFGHPTWVRPYLKVYLQAKICSYPSSSSSFRQVLPCVDVFVADEFFVSAPILRTRLALRLGAQLPDVPCVALGRPSCGSALHLRCGRALGRPTCRRALRCVGAPNLQTCLALRWGTQSW